MTEIKRCPFCGELPVVCLKHGDMHNVSCETMDCCGENDLWWETEQEAIEAWNTRYVKHTNANVGTSLFRVHQMEQSSTEQ